MNGAEHIRAARKSIEHAIAAISDTRFHVVMAGTETYKLAWDYQALLGMSRRVRRMANEWKRYEQLFERVD